MSTTYKSFEDLECWKAGKELRVFFMGIRKKLPMEEKFSLSDNLKRAARSVTNNVAEGFGRFHYQENIQYCRQARGSLYELIDHLMICREENYITDDEYKNGRDLINKTIAILNGYINYLIKAKKENELKQE
ncbi:MAG: hypothetical protein POELPBGB_01699 [Bacteroidia bacterium]|nr:hypothetical protein [Bacteroidia bacterium]